MWDLGRGFADLMSSIVNRPTTRKPGTVFIFNVVLMVVYNETIDASKTARGRFQRGKKVLACKFRLNIVKQFFYLLSDFMVTSSVEAMKLARSKSRPRRNQEYPNRRKRSKNMNTFHTANQFPLRNRPKLSSYGLSSTETTPNRIS